MIIEIEDDDRAVVGQDRRRAIAVVFTLCLAVGSAFVGRDSPVAISDESSTKTSVCDRSGDRCVVGSTMESAQTTTFVSRGAAGRGQFPAGTIFDGTLSLPANTTDVQLQVFPDWLANEQLPPMHFVPVRVRAVSGLAVEALRPGDPRIVTWTERGTVYWLISDRRDITDLVRLADSLR